jgi:hypothetical protein
MRGYFYYQTIRKTIIQFLDMFSRIDIARYNSAGSVIKYVNVPLKFGPKSKVYTWIVEQSRRDIVLPIMSVSMQSLEFASDRMGQAKDDIKVSTDIGTKVVNTYLTPIPYNIQFNLHIWSLYMSDIDQIYEQILPYFSPHAFVRINIPELDTTFDIKVVLQDSSPEIDDEWEDDGIRNIRWLSTFQVQTYVFKPISDTDFIEKIYNNIYTNEDAFDARDTTETYLPSGYTESIYQKGLSISGGTVLYDQEIFHSGE